MKYFRIQWHLTNKCDQKCKHCYIVESSSKELNLNQCKVIMDDLYSTISKWKLIPELIFTGGDPLLRPDFFEILDYAHEKGFRIRVLGNPYHVDLKIARKLKKMGVWAYQISLDGLEKTHDYLRRKGSFKESLNALRILKKAGIQTNVLFTLSKTNSKELVKLMRIVSKERVDVFSFARLVPIGSGAKLEMLKSDEFRSLLMDVLNEITSLKKKGVRTCFSIRESLYFLLLKELNLLPKVPNNGMIYDGCSLGIDNLTILPDGTVYPCRRLPIEIGRVPDQKIEDIFLKSKKLNELRNFKKFEKCCDCDLVSICRGCRAISYAVTGNPYAPDPQCWR